MNTPPLFSRLFTLAALAAVLVLCWLAWEHYTRSPWTRDSRVRADVVILSPEVSGRIAELPLRDNQLVAKGDLLLTIDSEQYQLAELHAQRSVAVARAALGQAEAAIVASDAVLKQKRSEEERRRKLRSNSVISNEEWEQARTDVAVSEAHLVEMQSNLGLAEANVNLAEAALEQARLDLGRTRLLAPVSGYVTNLQTRTGDYAQAGSPLLTLVDSNSFYVSSYFAETKLPRIKLGSRARVRLMTGQEP
ncbi:MAG: HlyD family secretion protein, partial [Parahaliea sp.]